MPLDTLTVARDLRKHGFTEEQADALTNAVRQAAGFSELSDLATKADLSELKADLTMIMFRMILSAVLVNTIVVVGAVIAILKFLGPVPHG